MQVFGQPLAKMPSWFTPADKNSPIDKNTLADLSKLRNAKNVAANPPAEPALNDSSKTKKIDHHTPWSTDSLAALRAFAQNAAGVSAAGISAAGISAAGISAAGISTNKNAAAERFTASDNNAPPQLKETLEKLFGVSGINGFDVRMKIDARSFSAQSLTQRVSAHAQTTTYAEKQQTSLALNMSGRFTTEDGRTFEFTVAYQHKSTFEANYVNHVETTWPSANKSPAMMKLPPMILDQLRQFLPDWGKDFFAKNGADAD
jgi:hypothetical protein